MPRLTDKDLAQAESELAAIERGLNSGDCSAAQTLLNHKLLGYAKFLVVRNQIILNGARMNNEQNNAKKFAKVEHEGDWFICRLNDLGSYLIDFLEDEGTSYTVTKIEMTEDEFKALPDFNGF